MRAFVWMTIVACGGEELPGTDSGEVPPADDALTEWTARLVGSWSGMADTPMGTIPFGMTGTETARGVRTSIEQMGMRFVLRFVQTDDGWVLTELGELPGGFVQEHDLVLVAQNGDETTWTSVEPGLMDMTTAVSDDVWTLDVEVRGEPHVTWTLERQ